MWDLPAVEKATAALGVLASTATGAGLFFGGSMYFEHMIQVTSVSLYVVFDTFYIGGYIELRLFVVNLRKQKPMNFSAGKILTAALAALTISGCSSIATQDAMDTERRLSAAGFQMKLADTPEKLSHLQTFADRRLVPNNLDGKTVFVYADAQSCKCVYVGSEANYQEYERLVIQQHVVDEQRATAEDADMAAEENAQMNWGLWGAWPRPIIY